MPKLRLRRCFATAAVLLICLARFACEAAEAADTTENILLANDHAPIQWSADAASNPDAFLFRDGTRRLRTDTFVAPKLQAASMAIDSDEIDGVVDRGVNARLLDVIDLPGLCCAACQNRTGHVRAALCVLFYLSCSAVLRSV